MPGVPAARRTELIAEPVGEELVIYDERTMRAHALNPVAAAVWRLADGSLTPEQIGERVAVPLALVEQALDELARCDLLDATAGSTGLRTHLDRRTLLKGTTAALFAAPLIVSAVIPAAAVAGVSGCSRTFSMEITGYTTTGDLTYDVACAGETGSLAPGGVIYLQQNGAVSQSDSESPQIEIAYYASVPPQISLSPSYGVIAVQGNTIRWTLLSGPDPATLNETSMGTMSSGTTSTFSLGDYNDLTITFN